MNIMQIKVAKSINEHFKRERKLMARQFSVPLLNEDQETLVESLSSVFTESNPSFDKEAFKHMCLNDV